MFSADRWHPELQRQLPQRYEKNSSPVCAARCAAHLRTRRAWNASWRCKSGQVCNPELRLEAGDLGNGGFETVLTQELMLSVFELLA